MEVDSAIALIDQVVYHPGWEITAEDHTNRFEGAIKVHVKYDAENTNRECAPGGYQEKIRTYACTPLIIGDCEDELALHRRVLRDVLLQIPIHEGREAYRLKGTYWAPFHPHKIGGIKAWGEDPRHDLTFGLA